MNSLKLELEVLGLEGQKVWNDITKLEDVVTGLETISHQLEGVEQLSLDHVLLTQVAIENSVRVLGEVNVSLMVGLEGLENNLDAELANEGIKDIIEKVKGAITSASVKAMSSIKDTFSKIRKSIPLLRKELKETETMVDKMDEGVSDVTGNEVKGSSVGPDIHESLTNIMFDSKVDMPSIIKGYERLVDVMEEVHTKWAANVDAAVEATMGELSVLSKGGIETLSEEDVVAIFQKAKDAGDKHLKKLEQLNFFEADLPGNSYILTDSGLDFTIDRDWTSINDFNDDFDDSEYTYPTKSELKSFLKTLDRLLSVIDQDVYSKLSTLKEFDKELNSYQRTMKKILDQDNKGTGVYKVLGSLGIALSVGAMLTATAAGVVLGTVVISGVIGSSAYKYKSTGKGKAARKSKVEATEREYQGATGTLKKLTGGLTQLNMFAVDKYRQGTFFVKLCTEKTGK